MAVVSRTCRLTFSNTITGFTRTWSATAATEETANGSSVTINYAMSTTGAAPPDSPNSDILVRVKNDAGTTIRTYSITPGTASQALTFFFTSDGQSGSASRHGTLFIDIQVTKTNGGPTATYDYETDGSPATPPSGHTATVVDRGFIVGTTTATVTASNVSAGGGKSEPAYAFQTVYHRVVLASPSYTSKQLTHVFSGTSKSTTSASGTGVTRDATFSSASIAAGRVNEGFPAADASYTATLGTVPNPAIATGRAYTTISVTTDTLRVDPRMTATHLLQLDDNSYGSPPMSKNAADGDRPSTAVGYLGTHIRHAQGGLVGDVLSGGLSGLTVDITLTASNGTVVSRTATTGTEGGEVGWTSGFMQWTNGLPGGNWTKVVDITSPSDLDGNDYLLNSSATYVLLASRSALIKLVIDAGHASSSANDRHMVLGDDFIVEAALEYTKATEEKLLEFDSAPRVAIKRFRSGALEYWDGSAWQVANPDFDTLVMSQDSTYVWSYEVTTDSSWGDVVVQVFGDYLGVRYDGGVSREFVGDINGHDAYAFDGAGFVGFPSR